MVGATRASRRADFSVGVDIIDSPSMAEYCTREGRARFRHD
jgi:hypothetical protein